MSSQRKRNDIRSVLHKQKERNARVNHLRPSLRLPSSRISIKGIYGCILEKFNQEYGLTHLTYEQRDKFPRTNEDAISIAMKHTVTKVPQDTRRNLNETEKNSTNAGSESGGGNVDTNRGQEQSNGNVSHAQRQSGPRDTNIRTASSRTS